MGTDKNIEHIGRVKRINDDYITVSVIKNSACASCEIKSACNISEVEEKEIEVKRFGQNYDIGEQVKVYFGESLGFRALMLGYIIPFLIVIAVIIAAKILNIDDGKAGITALLTLIPYYFILYLSRNKHKKTFSFYIKKV